MMKINNGLKSGFLIVFISILGIMFFKIKGDPIPVFFTRFLVVGIVVSAAGFFTSKMFPDDDSDDRRLR